MTFASVLSTFCCLDLFGSLRATFARASTFFAVGTAGAHALAFAFECPFVGFQNAFSQKSRRAISVLFAVAGVWKKTISN